MPEFAKFMNFLLLTSYFLLLSCILHACSREQYKYSIVQYKPKKQSHEKDSIECFLNQLSFAAAPGNAINQPINGVSAFNRPVTD
jgi:hypothetical protein